MFSLTAILANVLVAAMDVPEEYGDGMSVAMIILNVLVIVTVAGKQLLLNPYFNIQMINQQVNVSARQIAGVWFVLRAFWISLLYFLTSHLCNFL